MSNATKLWISEKRLTHKINNILDIIFRLNANVILSLLMCKSDIPVPFFYSCPDEEGGTFNEPEAERKLAEARAARLRDFQGNDLDIYSMSSFSTSLVT